MLFHSVFPIAQVPDNWGEDELMTLHEATALMWPDGVITVSTLRTAIRDGQLPHVRCWAAGCLSRNVVLPNFGRPSGGAEAQKKMLA